jgi:hypothetical protein
MSSLSIWILTGIGLYIALNQKFYIQAFQSLRDRVMNPPATYGNPTAKEIAATTAANMGWSKDKTARLLSTFSADLEGLGPVLSKEDLLNKMDFLFQAFELRDKETI